MVKPYRLGPARIRTWYHEYTSDFAHLTFRGPVRVPRDCDLILKALCSLVIYLHAPQKQQFLTRRVSLKSYYCQNQVMPGLKITSCYVSEIGAYTDYLNSALSYKLIAKTSKVPIVPGPNYRSDGIFIFYFFIFLFFILLFFYYFFFIYFFMLALF